MPGAALDGALRPEDLRRRVRTLPDWATSASALFDWLRARVTPEILTTIAHADYGTGAALHLAALEDLCATGRLPRVLPWEPREVLALRRWSQGETVDHLERAFCAVLLCLAPGDDELLLTNAPILIESCLALGSEAAGRAELLFAWLAETEEPGWEEEDGVGPDQPFALLSLLVLRAAAEPGDPRLEALARALLDHPCFPPDHVRAAMSGSMREKLWTDLFERTLAPLRDLHPAIPRLLGALGRT